MELVGLEVLVHHRRELLLHHCLQLLEWLTPVEHQLHEVGRVLAFVEVLDHVAHVLPLGLGGVAQRLQVARAELVEWVRWIGQVLPQLEPPATAATPEGRCEGPCELATERDAERWLGGATRA